MKLILLLLLAPILLQAQKHAFPSYITLQGNDKIKTERILLEITDKTATISLKNKVLTHRIIKTETNEIETVLILSCGGKLRLEYNYKQLSSFSFSCPGVVLFSSIAFCEAVERGEYEID